MDEGPENAQDLHDLVTPEPAVDDNGFSDSPTTASTSIEDQADPPNHVVKPQTLPIFSFSQSSPSSNGFIPSHQHTPSSMTNQQGNSRQPFISMSQSSNIFSHQRSTSDASRIPTLGLSPPASGSASANQDFARHSRNHTQPTITNIQKETDEVDDSYHSSRRPVLRHQTTATSTRLNRLFAPLPSLPSSREPSFQKQPHNIDRTRDETASLPHHLFVRGLLEGRHSDITVVVFGHSYKLHRIILDRTPFFSSALSEPWFEVSQKELRLYPEELDSNITQIAFELALKRLYGCSVKMEEDEEAMALFATGCWLEMQELVDDSVESILRQMGPDHLSPIIQILTSNYYGKQGDRILASAKAMLRRQGSDIAVKAWDGVPGDMVRELVRSDGFYVRDELSRWKFAKQLLDRRLKVYARDMGIWKSHSMHVPPTFRTQALRPHLLQSSDASVGHDLAPHALLGPWQQLYGFDEIQPLLRLLDEDIHYVHMDFEQLQSIRNARDVLGFPVLPGHVIPDALWSNLELRQRILNATEKELTLGLMHYTREPELSNEKTVQTTDSEGEPPAASPALVSKRSSPKGEVMRESKASKADLASPHRYLIPSADAHTVLGGNEEPIHSSSGANTRHTVEAMPKVESAPLDTELDDGNTTVNMDFQAKNMNQQGRTTAYSAYPPFRFSVEFPRPRALKDRRKFFSQTVFYAGSLWNIYVMKVKGGTKRPHLGVYLHRAPQTQGMTPENVQRGAVDERIGALEHRLQQRRGMPGANGASTYLSYEQNMSSQSSSNQTTAGAVPSANNFNDWPLINTTNGTFGQSRASEALDEDDYSVTDSDTDSNAVLDLESLTFQPRPKIPTFAPYVDNRPTIKIYFKIYVPSRGGRMLSVYESVPDKFNFSQSWGWKSSMLILEEDENERELALPETNFEDEGDAPGSSVLESGPNQLSTWSGRRKYSPGAAPVSKAWESSNTLRFMVVLGVV